MQVFSAKSQSHILYVDHVFHALDIFSEGHLIYTSDIFHAGHNCQAGQKCPAGLKGHKWYKIHIFKIVSEICIYIKCIQLVPNQNKCISI